MVNNLPITSMEMIIVIVLSCLGLYFLLALFNFLQKVWWTPLHIKHIMEKQGIKGPSYKFLHGNNKEISTMIQNANAQSMDISHYIFPRLQPHIHSWMQIYGTSFLHWRGVIPDLLVTEPEFVKEILNNKNKKYPKPEAEGYFKKITGTGILNSEGDKWTKLRKIANHSFHAESLKNMVPAMVESASMMLKRWTCNEGKEIDVYDEFRMLTSEVISRTAFGSSYLEGEEIFQMLRKLTVIVGRNFYTTKLPGLLSHIFKSNDDIESEKLDKRIKGLVRKIIEKKEKEMSGKVHGSDADFLGLLIKASQDSDEKNQISVEGIVDECKSFYAAGHGTTSLLLSWAVFLLSVHTDWQEKARQEVVEVLANQLPNSESITRLKIINMIIHETLRLYPPAYAVVRKVGEEAKSGNLTLPAGLNLTIPILAIHHDPKLWGKDAHLFEPGRFSQGIAQATNNNPTMFLPFGMGPRTCVGFNFAIIEAKIALAMILQRFKFTLSPNYVHSPVLIVTVRPKHGVQVMLQKIIC